MGSSSGRGPRTSGMGIDLSDGLYMVVAVLRGGRRLPIEIEATGPLAAQDDAEIVLSRRHLPVVEVLGSIEKLVPRSMAGRSRVRMGARPGCAPAGF
jgi:hypothetical protein